MGRQAAKKVEFLVDERHQTLDAYLTAAGRIFAGSEREAASDN